MEVVGRFFEKAELLKKLHSSKAELIAVLGRRRVGKTYLIRTYYQKNMFFQFTGLYQGVMEDQLMRFTQTLQRAQRSKHAIAQPQNWFEAFDLLTEMISRSRSKKKKVIFLDEFPWIATNKSKFLTAFTDFWNSYAVNRSDLIVVICGSAASWMINKVLKDKGGLHNRVTGRIILQPFTLGETQAFLRFKKIVINKQGIVQLYMALGGIPFYLDQIEIGESVDQAIDRLCFRRGSLLQLEYDELFKSLFTNADRHEKIVELLAKYPAGLYRDDLLKKAKLKTGGGVTHILDELMQSGFIWIDVPYGKKRNQKKYKLKDYYTIFYMKYIKANRNKSEKVWQKIASTPSFKSWSGLAFENVCMDHILQIKKALQIEAIISKASVWHSKSTDEMQGAQIDLVIDRADGIINICEIKYYNSPFVITKSYAMQLRTKMASFQHFTKTRKALFPTMITTYGLIKNQYSEGFIQNNIVMEDLFD